MDADVNVRVVLTFDRIAPRRWLLERSIGLVLRVKQLGPNFANDIKQLFVQLIANDEPRELLKLMRLS